MIATNYLLFPCLECGQLEETLNDEGLCITCQVDHLLDVDSALEREMLEPSGIEGWL